MLLGAIRAKVPELIEKKMGDGIQGEPDLTGIILGDLEAEEWRELLLDSVMADFIHLDAAVDTDLAEAYAMATVDSDGDDTSDSVLHSQWTRISPMG